MLCSRRLAIATGALLLAAVAGRAQRFPAVGNLACNGCSRIRKPLRPQTGCADCRSEYGRRGYDKPPARFPLAAAG